MVILAPALMSTLMVAFHVGRVGDGIFDVSLGGYDNTYVDGDGDGDGDFVCFRC